MKWIPRSPDNVNSMYSVNQAIYFFPHAKFVMLVKELAIVAQSVVCISDSNGDQARLLLLYISNLQTACHVIVTEL